MIFLDRIKFSDNETFGVLTDEDHPSPHGLCFTIELPWKDNKPRISCIPEGTYEVEQYTSPRHGDVWEIKGVPGRSNIEFHPANFASDLLGCVGVGDSMGVIGGKPAVPNSKETFKMLKRKLPKNFTLTISGAP